MPSKNPVIAFKVPPADRERIENVLTKIHMESLPGVWVRSVVMQEVDRLEREAKHNDR